MAAPPRHEEHTQTELDLTVGGLSCAQPRKTSMDVPGSGPEPRKVCPQMGEGLAIIQHMQAGSKCVSWLAPMGRRAMIWVGDMDGGS